MLEFNMPVHEGWNIVHIAMQVPEGHQIYVCPENCLRGVVMTAYEMGAGRRFSCVSVSERDLIVDNLETVTIDGVSDVVEEMHAGGEFPRVIFLFTVCSHRILSCDFDYVFRTLREKYPDIIWVHAYMDCIAQKEGLYPDMKLRKAMYEFIPKTHSDEKIVNLLGSEVIASKENNDIVAYCESQGIKVRQLSDITTFEEYMQLGNACMNICMYKSGDYGVEAFSERLGIPYHLMLPFFEDDTEKLSQILSDAKKDQDVIPEFSKVKEKYREFQKQTGNTQVVIDSMAIVCPYSLAEFMLEIGFNVTCVISDGAPAYEKEIAERLEKTHPELFTVLPTDPRLREEAFRKKLQTGASGDRKILAVGPMAAWVFNTPYFVNQIENDGAYGRLGMLSLLEKMRDAVAVPKEIEKTVLQKGIGSRRCRL
ncbi:MAG: nitrogenase component 1 [Candidatus Weimeria sp.]